jgi:hypothetical protein
MPAFIQDRTSLTGRSTLQGMERAGYERFGLTRLRWRLRGASQWPAFGAAVLAETLLLHWLPIAGSGTGVASAVLLALLFNLVAVAVLAPLLGLVVRRVRRDLPRVVARDYAGTGLVAAIAVVVVVLGVLHHPAMSAQERSFRALSDAVRSYVGAHAPPVVQANVDRTDVIALDTALDRACVPAPAGRSWCMLVDTSGARPQVRRDSSSSPNSALGHPIG